MRTPPLLTRLTRRQLIAADVAAAAVWTMASVWLLVTHSVTRGGAWTGPSLWLAAAFQFLVGGAIAIRRVRPAVALAVVTAASAGVAACGYLTGNQVIAVALVVYLAALVGRARPTAFALVGVLVVLSVSQAVAVAVTADRLHRPGLPAPAAVVGMLYDGAILLAAWSAGRAIRAARAYREGLREQAEQRARATAEAERLRIARELHDVVAHAMSVVAVQSGVGRFVIHDRPEEAEKALAAIETTSRAALADMRRLLSVLRDGRPGDLLPAPGLADLPELAEQFGQAGLGVDLTVRGEPRELPAGLDLAVFRIVQEALTNVMKHAETDRGRVLVRYAEEALEIEVTDDGVGSAPGHTDHTGHTGHGLVGMRERVALYGGRVEAGPLPRRGFRVAAWLPA